MHNNSNFGMCLSQLLSILNISGTKLAKALNVDPSLISKWKTRKRKICTNSNYLELISTYLADNIINEHQKQEIINLFNSFNTSIDDKYSGNMREYIHKLLITAQQSPSAIQNKNTLLKTLDSNQNSNNIYDYFPEKDFNKYGYLSNFEVITGHKNVIYAGMDLLKTLPKKPSYINDPILMSFFTKSDSFSNFEESHDEWNNTLLQVQKKGWNINKFITLTDNKNRNIKIINEFLTNFKLDRYSLNYLNKHNALLNFKEFLVIPTVGFLICHCIEDVNKIDLAFLIRDEQMINVMKNVFNNYSAHSSPVIDNKYNLYDINLLSKISASEESNGNRFALNQLIVPLDNFSKYISSEKRNISKKEISAIISFYTKRLATFNKQIKHYKYYDIWSKKSIENLIKNSEKTFKHINSYDLLNYLENIINIFEKNDNYQVGLLNDTNTKKSYDISYIIKDSQIVFLQNHYDYNNNYYYANDSINHDICISITEPTLVHSFNNHFWQLWNEVSPINKDKKLVISWLKDQIKVLNNL
ncbi:hypothetical protein [Oceanirhabdus seepicola]|uniref:Uncharacterized protein n=1 Tax=Oceanirhabdus seepicola TaxID=2828781 RepID=A0A9J6P269_9CLOT|nr:hypothetical protein [Oceanirhabdus seepicola]MCM1989600.1 hypothetical protein [Oceanirhabdus seepicola]